MRDKGDQKVTNICVGMVLGKTCYMVLPQVPMVHNHKTKSQPRTIALNTSGKGIEQKEGLGRADQSKKHSYVGQNYFFVADPAVKAVIASAAAIRADVFRADAIN